MKPRECLCGRGQECNALSFAFFVLEDPRSGYTAMPRMIRSESDSPTLLLVSQLRDAYLRNLLSEDATPAQRAKASKQTSKRQFVANHHFHPQIVIQSTKGQTCKIPWFIDEEMAKGLNLGLTDEDRLRDGQGNPTDEYFLAPTYHMESTKKDLQRLVRAEKKMSQAKNRVTTSNYTKPWAKENNNTPTENNNSNNNEGEQQPQTFTNRRKYNNDSKEDDDLHSIGNDSILMNWEENCEKPYRDTQSPTGTAVELEKSIGPDAFSASFGMISSPLQASNGNLPNSTASPLSKGSNPQTILSSVPDCVEINSSPGGSGGDSVEGNGTGGDDLSIGMQGLPAEDIQDSTTLPQLQNRRPRTYDELLAFEAKRRTYYAAQMTTTLRNLQAVVQLLIEGKRETSKACRLVAASALASQTYARDMEAIFEDYLVDDSFAFVTNPWQQKQLKQRRNNPENIFEQHIHGSTPEQELLDLTLEIQSTIGNAFAETARHVEDNIMQEFTEFEKYIVDTVNEKLELVEDLSDAMIHELQTAERKVQEAWGTLDGIACEELLVDAESVCSQGDYTLASQASKTCPDLWLNEMYYRVSVHYLSSTWRMATSELHTFQQSLLQIEKDRRVRLHELLLEFQPRQKRLGSRALAIVQDPALKHLIDTHLQVSVEDIEYEVKLAVQLQSKSIQKQQTKHTSSILNRTRRSMDFTGDSMAMDLGIEKLDTAVVDSQFVFASKVMERNNPEHATYGGVKWETTLAVITNNSYLHLFHIPHLGKDVAPREAFRQWQSGVQISELRGVWEHEQNAGIQRLLEKVTPSESWFLPKCTVKRISHYGTEFEISESAVNMFGKSAISRKIELRTKSAPETSHWIDTKMEPNMWGGNAGADIQCVGISAVDKAENLKLLPLTNLPASMLTPPVAPFRKRPSSSSSPPSASSSVPPVLAKGSTVVNCAVTQLV